MTEKNNEQTVMYSQLQPWSTVGSPPCVEPVSGPTVAPRVGTYYQTPRPHPWRPTLGFETIEVTPLPETSVTNQLMKPCTHPPGMSTEPLTFPNLVTGFERNPQHAARAALYTRYTPTEWHNNFLALLAESDAVRSRTERFRCDTVRLMRETDERTSEGQRDTGRRIGERITDVTFWRNELNTELEKLVAESSRMQHVKLGLMTALQDLEGPLHIAQECLYHREGRKGVEKTHDDVEKALLIEVDNLRSSQKKLQALFERISNQLSKCRAAQHALEEDVVNKESAIGIDSLCHQLNNFSRGINFYGGIEKYDPTVSTAETWSAASNYRVQRSQAERAMSTQIRSDIEANINAVAATVWDCWINTNNAFEKRAAELTEAKNKVQMHLHKVQQEIFDIEKYVALLQIAIKDQLDPLKVAHTRLEARTHRSGLEQCKDFAQLRLVQEVEDIKCSQNALHEKLQETEAQHQLLLKTRSNLETDLKNKVNTLFIDREKCMGMRRSFPVEGLIKY